LQASLNRQGHTDALRQMVFASKANITAILPSIKAPTMLINGANDPDFPSPKAELDWIASQISGESHLVAGTGHYPHVEKPELITQFIENFVTATITSPLSLQ
jgi:pimeloyl-ACP methyl ester carboxylesterase